MKLCHKQKQRTQSNFNIYVLSLYKHLTTVTDNKLKFDLNSEASVRTDSNICFMYVFGKLSVDVFSLVHVTVEPSV